MILICRGAAAGTVQRTIKKLNGLLHSALQCHVFHCARMIDKVLGTLPLWRIFQIIEFFEIRGRRHTRVCEREREREGRETEREREVSERVREGGPLKRTSQRSYLQNAS